MPAREQLQEATLRVIDALDHPHGHRILRARVTGPVPPTIRELKGSHFRAIAPDGRERRIRVLGFPVFGGKPSDERIRRTGRVDLLVEQMSGDEPVSSTWELYPAQD